MLRLFSYFALEIGRPHPIANDEQIADAMLAVPHYNALSHLAQNLDQHIVVAARRTCLVRIASFYENVTVTLDPFLIMVESKSRTDISRHRARKREQVMLVTSISINCNLANTLQLKVDISNERGIQVIRFIVRDP